uniref:O-acyltransferase n=1 Tax=Caenorhabditis japonica TaxID=281687 RepID=A0A8R1DQ72_CAEJA
MRHPNSGRRRRQPSEASNGSSIASSRRSSFAQNGGNGTSSRKSSELKGPCERVIHSAQDSLFSTSSGWTNFRGFFNLSILLLVLSNGRVALENVIKYGILITPLQWLATFVEDYSFTSWPNLGLILGSNLQILTVFGVEKILERGWVGNAFAAVFYPLMVITHLTIPVVVTLKHTSKNPLWSVAMMSIYVIESLKFISYGHVNYWARDARRKISEIKSQVTELARKTSDPKQFWDLKEDLSMHQMASAYPSNLTIFNIYYFMAAPTLCYEFKFPRTPRIRKRFLIKRIVELIFLSFLIAALVQQWVVPTVRNSMRPLSEMEFSRCLERLLKLAIPNHLIWLIFFYTFFHSFLNLVAEILRFADREFYRDFWNAETIAYFWKSWNIPVHRFAVRHIYMPMTRNRFSKMNAFFVVFFVSAFFHEYLVSVPLKMFRLWSYYGMMGQIPLSFLTGKVIRGGRTGNIIVWLSLIVGQPLAILMYGHDWYVLNFGLTAARNHTVGI